MTTKSVAPIAAGFLALGILVGAAGTIVVRDATTTDFADQMRGMTASAGSMGSMGGMTSMMAGGDMAGMMSMMGDGHLAEMPSMMGDAGSPMMPDASTAPDVSTSPEDHREHHTSPSPAATR
jgi:hypothetical protein